MFPDSLFNKGQSFVKDQATEVWRGIEVRLLKQRWSRYFRGKILDLGCGDGRVSRQVFNKGQSFVKELWGLDNDREMVRKAEKSRIYTKVIRADAGKMPLKSNSVDLVFSNSVLEHIKNIEAVLKEVKRVLKPAGYLIATMPGDTGGEYLGWGKLYACWFNKKYRHFHLYNREKWQSLLAKHGLKLIDSYYYLDEKTIKLWHKLLWLNKLGIRVKYSEPKAKYLALGGALAVLAQKR